MVVHRCTTLTVFVALLLELSATPAAPVGTDEGCEARAAEETTTLFEIEQLEAEESTLMQVQLLQSKVEVKPSRGHQASEPVLGHAPIEPKPVHLAVDVASAFPEKATPPQTAAAPVAAPAHREGEHAAVSALGLLQEMNANSALRRSWHARAYAPTVVDVLPPSSPAGATDSEHSTGPLSTAALEAIIPSLAVIIGFMLVPVPRTRLIGLLIVYFGVQTGLNLYMKVVLSSAVVSTEKDMKGIPGAFLITGLQQVVSFLICVPMLGILWMTPWRYTPKPLTTVRAWAGLFGLAITFALNIGLNNLCLSLLPMSINLMIRSCIPLTTWLLQTCLSSCCSGAQKKASKPAEVLLMLLGVFFAALASVAKSQGSAPSKETENLGIGILIGVLSLGACSSYLLLAQWLGQEMALNPIDMTLYMSVPSAVFLLPLMFFLEHPVGWPEFGPMTDYQVLQQVLDLSPEILGMVALSGLFAVFYNTLQYTMVSELSATHTAFAGNFNKAATIVLSLSLGLETLPAPPWGPAMILAIVGGVASFTAYSIIRSR